ncbi:MAG TPA: cob(I)yrinic acid a,c-diamide adenosyltransferase [Verrucomicrobiae bacterium]|nr:cob(I)yrinic acid a,c-diamide adenosyltransferase [Verrucomicrobiae bacterium]
MSRLTKIYTKTGDKGETGLVGGKRVSKDSPRIWAYGTVDELNAAIGLARAFNTQEESPAGRRIDQLLARIQNELFHLGAELATLSGDFREGMPRVDRSHVAALEKLMDDLNLEVGPLKEFILPGGCKTAAALHQARTICRRAERFCVRLARSDEIGEHVVPYLNRLSDALFVLARWANKAQGVKETPWEK